MSLANDLLEQATHLAEREQGRPKQASLRRALSSAYYALFHLLVADASRTLLGGAKLDNLRARIGRTFEHGEMKQASKSFSTNPSKSLPMLMDAAGIREIPPDLVSVANTFVRMQQVRHQADYNLDQDFIRREVRASIAEVQLAFEAWHRIKGEPIAKAYLIALLLHTKLGRGD